MAPDTMAFDDAFALLTGGYGPFPWQRKLYGRFVAADFPKMCGLPTGLGKTSVIHIWLLALAVNPSLPRRLVYVVNRRTVVDQATDEAEKLREVLSRPGPLRDALAKHCAVAPRPGEAPLAISTLRGERADNAQWRRDPAAPSIIVGTVDMVGSRLLFSGYGCGFRSKPLHAGFLGQDALLIHDEAHLEPAFQQLLEAIREEQFASREARPLRVMALSATGREQADFTLSVDDEKHDIVRRRLNAKKGLRFHAIADRKELPDRAAAAARQLEGRVIVFLTSLDHVEKCAALLRKSKKQVATLTGTMRGYERDSLVRHPVLARFLARPADGAKLHDGTVYLVATSAGEVGIDLSADHMVSDLPPFDALAQRLGRVNRYGYGDARVEVFCESLKPAPKANAEGEEAEEDGKSGKRKDEYEWARFATRELLDKLPPRADGRLDGSPEALGALPPEARQAASTPIPEIRHVDHLLFDRWSYTTVTEPLPGRPPVDEWLHGVAEWEPPRTTVSWRSEVNWLTEDLLGTDSLDEFLADYRLRSREILSDVTSRVVKHLQKIAARDRDGTLRVWLIRHDAPTTSQPLVTLLEQHDPGKNPLLDGATVVLPPQAGGLGEGMLDGDVEFAEGDAARYDLGPRDGERLVVQQAGSESVAPAGMRLVRSVRREGADGETQWWRLYAVSRLADDEGSRTSRRGLPLAEHLHRAEAWARRIAERLGLPASECKALACAGRWHDLGKTRRVWQRSIKNFADPPLAKGPMQPSDLSHYRHELGSLHDLLAEAGFDDLTTDGRELVLHLVAAHHGRARPHFPPREAYDPEVRDDIVAPLVREVPLRFDRLQRRYGRWALAWLESLLRAADTLASEDEDSFE